MNSTFAKARCYIYRNARPLDMARWQYHFEGGSKDAVLTALAAYQNEDGGFAHALEPDAWNPNSSPMQTWTATEVLREIEFTDPAHPMIRGILSYLASGQDFEGAFWYSTVRSNNDFPHAPWWHSESDSISHHSYNPTACLAGFIVRSADKGSGLYQLGCRIAREAHESYFTGGMLEDVHTANCFIGLWQYCEEAGVPEIIDISALRERLRAQVRHSITTVTHPNGKQAISAGRRSFSTALTAFSTPTTRRSPTTSAISSNGLSLTTDRGVFLGDGTGTRKNGQSARTGGKATVLF